jgi:hypothetical protein
MKSNEPAIRTTVNWAGFVSDNQSRLDDDDVNCFVD